MTSRTQRRLLHRELELMSTFALEMVSELRTAPREDRLTLVQGLLSTSLKLSRLLWPFGRRAGDDRAFREAADLRDQLGIGETHPLAPERTPPLAAALRLSDEELLSVLDLDRDLLTLAGRAFPLQVLARAISDLHHGLLAITDSRAGDR